MLSSVASCDCVPILGFSHSNASSLFKGHTLFPFIDSLTSVQCEEHVNLIVNVAQELIGKKLLNYTDKALCVGEGSSSAASAMRELGIQNAVGVDGHHFFSLRQKQFVYELDFKDNSLDFDFFRNLDKLYRLALLVIEIERILRPGGVGAVIIGMSSSKPNSLIRSASPVSSVLKNSNIVHVGYVHHPDLAGNRGKAEDTSDGEDIDPSMEIEEGFNFLEWFKEIMEYADFVVLKMNAREMELKFLLELFESGEICSGKFPLNFFVSSFYDSPMAN